MAGVHAPDNVLPEESFLIGCHKAPKGRPSVHQDIESSLLAQGDHYLAHFNS